MGRGYKRTKRTSHFEREVRALLFLLEVVVVDFDAEDDAAAGGGDEVGEKERPDDVGLVK